MFDGRIHITFVLFDACSSEIDSCVFMLSGICEPSFFVCSSIKPDNESIVEYRQDFADLNFLTVLSDTRRFFIIKYKYILVKKYLKI